MLTLKQAKELFALGAADQVSRNKLGHIILRKGYFYRKSTAESWAEKITNILKHHNIAETVNVIEDHWYPFKGGAPLSKQSHFYIEIFQVIKMKLACSIISKLINSAVLITILFIITNHIS